MRVNYFWESEKLINEIRQLQPDIMINNRGGWEGDFHVRERRIDGMRTDKPWDSNDCIADSWGYIPGRPVLPLRQLIQNLVSIAVRDGNYLLNIGPDGTGKMDEEQVERLRQAGEWLSKYGETLYGLRGGPVIADRWGGTTYRDNIVYVHILEWEKIRSRLKFRGIQWKMGSDFWRKSRTDGRKRNLFNLRPDSGARQH